MSRRDRRRAAALKAALMQLPEQQRAVFNAVAVEGASYTDVAERLGFSTDEVEHQLAAVLVMLDKALETPPQRRFRRLLVHLFASGPSG